MSSAAPAPSAPPDGSNKEAERPGKILISLNHTSSKKHKKKQAKSVAGKGY